MATASAWLAENWFVLVQGIGIIGGLLFTALSVRRDTRARKATDLLTLSAQHREIWREMHERPGLARILKDEVDLIAQPISPAEEEYLNTIIVHFSTGWHLARSGALVEMKDLAGDVRTFFSLPIPKLVWKCTKEGRNSGFVEFVDECLLTNGRNRKRH